jgi:cytochrome P450
MTDLGPTERKYDLYSQATKDNPYPVFAAMRQNDPVFCQPGINRNVMIWFLTRYEDVEAMLRDDTRFVRDESILSPRGPDHQPDPLDELLNNHMLNKDGADHRRLRALAGRAFTPARIRALRPDVQELAEDLVAAVRSRGQMDLIADYAFQLPTIVISELLGVPVEDRERFKDWSNAFVAPALDEAARARAVQRLHEFVAYLRALFAARRQQPRDDLISALLQAEESGDQLSEGELYSTVVILIVAGHETTVNLIGNAMLALLRQPELADRLRRNPAQMEAAVEEFLRFDGPVERALVRWATEDIEMGGHAIKRGDLVIGILDAANRDPQHAANPDVLDLDRGPQRHLAFGHGAHYCLGAPLARLEGEIALNTLLQHLPELRLAAPESGLRWRTIPMFRGLAALPVEWSVTKS